jgi:hypothetical protein
MTRARNTRRPAQAYRPSESRPRVSPGAVMLAIALGGSVVFAVFTITVRDASQIPLLASGAAVLGIAFLALAAYSARATWHAGIEARNQRAIVMAVAGGMAAIVGAGCLAGAIILFLLSRTPTSA